MRQFAALLFVLLVVAGCGPREVVIRHVPPTPDIAYYDGVEFHSMDGMNRFDKIVIDPVSPSLDVVLLFPNGASIGVQDLTCEQLEKHNVTFDINGNDGQGNFRIIADGGLQARFTSHQPSRITIYARSTEQSRFSFVLRGHTITPQIKRLDLEAMLGEPDEIKLGRRGR